MALNALPIELNQQIASYLEEDRDICNFRLICQNTRNAIDGDKFSFWRRRFKDAFDPILRSADTNTLKETYQHRRKVIQRRVKFRSGRSPPEIEYLKVLRDLVVECASGATDQEGYPVCHNEHWIRKIVLETNFLHEIFIPKRARTPTNPLMMALQLALCHYSFDQSLGLKTWGFPDSQQAAYSSVTSMPIFVGFNKLQVNLVWVLHIMNFFKYHITSSSEHTLFEQFAMLESWEKPQEWKSQLRGGAYTLGKYWKGTYSYVERHEMDKIRRSDVPESDIIGDQNVNNPYKAIQTLRLSFPSGKEAPWPRKFEKILHSLPQHQNAKTRAQHRSHAPPIDDPVSFRFNGRGYDDEDFYSSGWLNALPPQSGIPGWQRLTMMKYFIDENGFWDDEALWAYEGVVLPGGQIILGRWWSPEDDHQHPEQVYSGPFIFWNINGNEEEMEEGYGHLAMDDNNPDNGIGHWA